jgi:hypothetical protein
VKQAGGIFLAIPSRRAHSYLSRAIARLAVDLRDFDYSQPAHVLWFTHVSDYDQISAGESRPFLEVTDAIRFIMERLDGVTQATAFISLDTGSLTLTEIVLLYARLGRGNRYPQLH